jgi:hypothetical protein
VGSIPEFLGAKALVEPRWPFGRSGEKHFGRIERLNLKKEEGCFAAAF